MLDTLLEMVDNPITSGDTLAVRTIKLKRLYPDSHLTTKKVWIAQQRV